MHVIVLALYSQLAARETVALSGRAALCEQGRLTLLLGPPGSGKSTLLKALAGKLQGASPRVTGRITYNGETFDRFVPQRTAAYVSQVRNSCTCSGAPSLHAHEVGSLWCCHGHMESACLVE